MSQSNYQNPFDIKSSPLYYASFQTLLSKYNIKSVKPLIDSGSNILTYSSKIFYLGKIIATAANDSLVTQLYIYNSIGSAIGLQTTSYYKADPAFSRILESDGIMFTYILITNVNSLYFVGYQIEVE